jgi:8-oxo-dGTP pyrophosphatase MutT (NUDIX family)
MNRRLPETLAARLTQPLPGPMVGTRFEPSPRLGRRYDQPPHDAKQSAVLALIYPHEDCWHLPLTLRPSHLPLHPSQICLPGGALEPGENGPQGAVREFHEEMGGMDVPIELLGRLSTIYVNASNFIIEPWVGIAPRRPQWTPSEVEVEAVLEVPLAHLLDPANFGSHARQHQGLTYEAPHFAWQTHQIWGATCMILGELVTVLEEIGV